MLNVLYDKFQPSTKSEVSDATEEEVSIIGTFSEFDVTKNPM